MDFFSSVGNFSSLHGDLNVIACTVKMRNFTVSYLSLLWREVSTVFQKWQNDVKIDREGASIISVLNKWQVSDPGSSH